MRPCGSSGTLKKKRKCLVVKVQFVLATIGPLSPPSEFVEDVGHFCGRVGEEKNGGQFLLHARPLLSSLFCTPRAKG